MKFPFSVYEIISGSYTDRVQLPPEQLLCATCGRSYTNRKVNYHHVQELTVVGENETEWFVEVSYDRDSDYGDYQVTDIETRDKTSCYITKEEAELVVSYDY